MAVSNKKIYKLSKKIRLAEGEVSDEDLKLIQEFRTSFTHPLSSTFHKLRRISNKVDRDAIVTFRLKRIGTIINKLLRLPNTHINTMGDVAGLRCIFRTTEDVYLALDLIKEKFKYDKNIRDYYIKDIKELGYKAVHIYIFDAKTNKKIEIQLRTVKDHNWSTLVEITDFLYGTRLKELGTKSHPAFARFHTLMSSDKELSHSEALEIYDVLDENNFINELSNTFRKNSNKVKRRWARQPKKHSYFLIKASKKDIPQLTSFGNFKKAEEEYFKEYRENPDAEVVLTFINKPNFSQISIAYANYILSYHNFRKDIKPILKAMAKDAIEHKEYSMFRRIFKTYEQLQANIILDILSDSEDIYFDGFAKGKILLQPRKNLSRALEVKIMNSFNKEFIRTGEEHREFLKEIKNSIPEKGVKRLLYKAFLKRHNKRLKKRLAEMEFEFKDARNSK